MGLGVNESYNEGFLFNNYIKPLRGENKEYREIAQILNDAGYRTATGKPFAVPHVSKIAVNNGLRTKAPFKKRSSEERAQDPVRPMTIIEKCFKTKAFTDNEMQYIISRVK